MRYLELSETLEIYRRIIAESGGAFGVRNLGALESALAQPMITFGGNELYPTIIEKASALGYSIIMNHPFVDGNKRTGHAAMETFLVMNGYEIVATVDEQEAITLRVASSNLSREEFTLWLSGHVRKR